MRQIDVVVGELIKRLESEGVGGVYTWFADRPHVTMFRQFDDYIVLLWRDGVVVEIRMDEKYNVKMVNVRGRLCT